MGKKQKETKELYLVEVDVFFCHTNTVETTEYTVVARSYESALKKVRKILGGNLMSINSVSVVRDTPLVY